ncbi:LacI family DNA-binding transcriptional regulator [Phototrophicus methaneseepsis]|uniref:LacI family DNA-binding transcriptional regulator n=1 Tax=Phototrophicus methaneseepsis TaxID=2710758 RepID=A0A7S8EAH8_9CHLR|nr:LacI family DNA-binding transcriptional regulator [Phototrophicus methaneseepsis]QPC83351.1 LacI family DNA-binding transcriptional regulator [Phototrophicus methaneseepsis]
MSRRPTQKDVADRAGVSRVTVSKVLNGATGGSVPISPETQARVLEAAHELGYSPNPVAQMLKQGSNRLLGIFVYEPEFPYDVDNHLFHHLLGVQREASALDYNIVSFTSNHNNGNPKIYDNGMNTIRLADGCIIMGAMPDREELRNLASESYPFVYVGRREIEGHEIDWVTDDYAIGSGQAVRHLIELGHRQIGFISGKFPPEATADKREGCLKAIAQTEAHLIDIPALEDETPHDLMNAIQQHHITALICTDQGNFHNTLQILVENNVRMPEDISLIALTPPIRAMSMHLFPGVVSFVQLDRSRVGKEAVRLLVHRLRNETPAQNHIRVPCELVVGETTGPPRE